MTKRVSILLLAFAIVLSACGSPVTATPVAATAQPATQEPKRTQYPVTITDCDERQTTYEKAPERVVTIDPSVTEMLLTLGLKDKIVGYTEFYTEAHQWPTTKTDMAALNQINDINVGYPSQEAIVAVSPDFVTSVYPWAFGYGLPDRDGWTQLGVKSYETLGGCLEKADDFSVLYEDLRNFGIIFDVQERAEAEIAKLQARVEGLQAKVKDAGLAPKRIVIYDSTAENPPVYGGTINAVIKLAGAEYIWETLPANTTPSWEDFVAANPDAIWIIPDSGPTAEELIQKIESDPRLKDLAAVQNKAYIIVPQSDATIESPRLVDGLEELINGLIGLKSSTSSRTQYPVTITDCGGRETRYEKAPERVVTLDDHMTETMLSLGLGSRIVGFTKLLPPEAEWNETKAEMDKLTIINGSNALSSGFPSKEVVLAQNPDMVMSVYFSAFDASYGPGTHDDWTQLNINSYETLQECAMHAKGPQFDFSLLFQDIRNLGIIFDVQDRAESLISRLEQRIASLQAEAKANGVGSYRIGTTTGWKENPGTIGLTAGNAIIYQAGSTYAFIEDDTFTTTVSWEIFIQRDPQVIWMITGILGTAEDIQKQLESDPRLVSVDAVKNKRFIDIPYDDAVGSTRCIDGLQKMIEGLIALKKKGL